ncbi:mannitol 1-phosphate dehydrogenase [Venturia nashicola]|nr:mannitol 1-phosphate dehydrogenase [Venturia nashicola]
MPTSDFLHPPKKPFHIAVVGGGIAGLTITLALLEQGIPVTLYEAASKFGEIGAGVSFGPNASRAMKLISPEIYDGFQNRATCNQSQDKSGNWFSIQYGEDLGQGDLITELQCEGGHAAVHRAHFLDELVHLLPEGSMQFKKRAIAYEQDDQGVTIKFQDGTEAKHDALIGCDGIKSKMRLCLLGEQDPASRPVYSGKYAYRGLIPMVQAKELLGEEKAQNSQMYYGRNGHLLTFSIEKGKTMNVVAFSSSESWDSADWVVTADKEKMYSDFSSWNPTVRNILSLVEKPDIWALFQHPNARTYADGNVALLGDSAHATTPHQGAGAGMCVEDSYIMSNLLGEVQDKKDIAKAFAVYDQVRRPRSQNLVKTSREAGMLYEMELVGEEREKIKANLENRMKWLWDYDIEGELKVAKTLLEKAMMV